jgi:curved DNA-binding protein CbpA
VSSRRRDHYVVLGVERGATHQEIRQAYRRLARASHPDASPDDPEAERQFKRVAAAWHVLGDPGRRTAYDSRRAGQPDAPGGSGPASYPVDQGPIYHSDLGHYSDFYQAGDPLSVAEAAALVHRDPGWLRRAIRDGRLVAVSGPTGYSVRRRDVERLDRSAPRRGSRGAGSGSGSSPPTMVG